ncbi:sulfatase-like hydrolase/transferase [Helicobacter sp. 23-1048]
MCVNLKFLYIVVLNSVFYGILRYLNFFEFFTQFAKSFLLDFCVLFALCVLLSNLPCKIAPKATNFTLNVLFMFSFVVGVVNIFLLLNFNSTLNPASFEIFLASNLREIEEFGIMYANTKSIVALALFIALSVFCATFKRDIAISKPLNIAIVFATAVFVCVGIVKFIKSKNFGFLATNFANKSEICQFIKVIYGGFVSENQIIAEFRAMDKKLDLALQVAKSANGSQKLDVGGGGISGYISQKRKIPKIVLIIGESTQRNYMNLYGYPLPNTPRLNALQDSQNLFVFSDIIAPAGDTATVLKKVLTFSNFENSHIKWYKNMNIIDAMKLLGYRTVWISNQEAVSMHNSFDIIAKRANILRYARLMESTPRAMSDKAVIEIYDGLRKRHLDSLGQDSQQNLRESKHIDSKKVSRDFGEFIVFHLQGTHYIYNWRYSADFALFSVEDLQQNGLDKFYGGANKGANISTKQAKTRAHYINAIAYNDYIVSEIFSRFANDEAIIFYLSDHGDEIYDIGDFAGHGPAENSRFVLEIPFMIYVSDSFKSRNPRIMERIKKAQNLPFMSDNFIHALFDLVGIECADCRADLSLFSDKYNANRARIINDKDYDKEIRIN